MDPAPGTHSLLEAGSASQQLELDPQKWHAKNGRVGGNSEMAGFQRKEIPIALVRPVGVDVERLGVGKRSAARSVKVAVAGR